MRSGARAVVALAPLARASSTAWLAGRLDAAWGVFSRILPLLRFQLQPGLGVSAQKHNLVAAGVIASAHVRHPTAALDHDSLTELAHLRRLADGELAAMATVS